MSRRTALALVWTLPSAVFLAATAVVYFAFRIPPPHVGRVSSNSGRASMFPGYFRWVRRSRT